MSKDSSPSDDQSTENSTESNPSGADSSSKGWKFSIDWLQSFFIKASVVVSILMVVFFTIKELTNKSFAIQPFSLPSAFVEDGYTGEVFASAVLNNLNHIVDEANNRRTLKELDEYSGSLDQIEVELEISGVAISPEAISGYLKRIFELEQRIISGAVVRVDNSLQLILNISGDAQKRITQKIDSVSEHQALRILSLKAAEEILKSHNHLLAGLYFYEEDEFDQAIFHFRAAAYEQPDVISTAYAHWGDAILAKTRARDTLEAVKLVRKSLEYDPENGTAYRILGNMYEEYSLEKAERYYRKSVEVDPTSERSWYRLAVNLSNDKGNDEEAISCYQKAFELNKQHTAIIGQLAALHCLRGEYGKAAEQLQFLQYLEPGSEMWSEVQAIGIAISEGMGDSTETMDRIRAAADKTEVSDALNSMAYDLEQREDYEAAFRLVKLAIIADSSFGLPYTTLAELCALTGDKDGFYKNLDEALQKGWPVEELAAAENSEPYRSMSSEERYKKLKEKYN